VHKHFPGNHRKGYLHWCPTGCGKSVVCDRGVRSKDWVFGYRCIRCGWLGAREDLK